MWGNEISFHLSRPTAKYSPWQTKCNVKVNSPEVSATISRRDGVCGFQGLQRWFQPQIVWLLIESVSRLLYRIEPINCQCGGWLERHLKAQSGVLCHREILLNRIYIHLSPFHINEMPEFWEQRHNPANEKSFAPVFAPDSHSEALLCLNQRSIVWMRLFNSYIY